MTNRLPNLILGTAEAMEWPELEPFVVSLRRTSFSGDVVLFVADLDGSTASALTDAGIQLRPMRRLRLPAPGGPVDAYDPRLARLHPAYPAVIRQLSRPSRDSTLTAARLAAAIAVRDVRRFFLYYRYLSARRHSYANVMLTDVRDVVFQSDPFGFDLSDNVHCFLEDERQPIGAQPHNRKWVQTALGDDVLGELADLPVVCAGVTIGPCERVVSYLRVMVDYLLRLRTQRTGLDQAVHNYVVHNGLVPGVRLVPNGTPIVATLGTVPLEDLPALQEAAVLHQYDRHPALAAALRRRYAEPVTEA
jgi:hypothetical protein